MDKEKNDLIILLTATITPNSLLNLTIVDPQIREKQYQEAIEFYIKNTNLKIVFVENSGNELKNFPKLPARLEYLSFNSQPIYPDRGIGYKELEIIRFALKNSTFLKNAKAIAKITGRLKILNIRSLSKKFIRLNKKNLNLIYAYPFKIKNMDARCFFFSKDFWFYLEETGKNIDKKYNFELALWDATNRFQEDKHKKYLPFLVPLRVEGISGSFGLKYKSNILFHTARFIRNFISLALGTKSIKKKDSPLK